MRGVFLAPLFYQKNYFTMRLDRHIMIRISTEDYNKLLKDAQKARLPISSFIRNKMTKDFAISNRQ
jgi:hypothetical protein